MHINNLDAPMACVKLSYLLTVMPLNSEDLMDPLSLSRSRFGLSLSQGGIVIYFCGCGRERRSEGGENVLLGQASRFSSTDKVLSSIYLCTCVGIYMTSV